MPPHTTPGVPRRVGIFGLTAPNPESAVGRPTESSTVPTYRFGEVLSLLSGALRQDEERLFIGQPLGRRRTLLPVWLLAIGFSLPVPVYTTEALSELLSIPVYGVPVGAIILYCFLGCASLLFIARAVQR